MRLGSSANPVRLSLALQGGGAHGAFTWGVLDRLLEEEKSLDLRAVSGTSAGAFNAVALAAGMLENGCTGAKQMLHDVWRAVAEESAHLNSVADSVRWFAPFNPMNVAQAFASLASPYDFTSAAGNPLGEILESHVDFQALRNHSPIELFIAATDVQDGTATIFRTRDVTVDAVLASACLPQVFRAVEIDDRAYWDGGFSANPALFPLIDKALPADVLIVHINPLNTHDRPKSAAEIRDRQNEIMFNTALLGELRALAAKQEMIRQNWFANRATSKYSRLRLHSLAADDALGNLPAESAMNTRWPFLTDLRDRGREAAERWLARYRSALGKTSSFNLKPFGPAQRPAPGKAPGS